MACPTRTTWPGPATAPYDPQERAQAAGGRAGVGTDGEGRVAWGQQCELLSVLEHCSVYDVHGCFAPRVGDRGPMLERIMLALLDGANWPWSNRPDIDVFVGRPLFRLRAHGCGPGGTGPACSVTQSCAVDSGYCGCPGPDGRSHRPATAARASTPAASTAPASAIAARGRAAGRGQTAASHRS